MLSVWRGRSLIRASVSGDDGGELREEMGLETSWEVEGMEDAGIEEDSMVGVISGRLSLVLVVSKRSCILLVDSGLVFERISGFLNGALDRVVRGLDPPSDRITGAIDICDFLFFFSLAFGEHAVAGILKLFSKHSLVETPEPFFDSRFEVRTTR